MASLKQKKSALNAVIRGSFRAFIQRVFNHVNTGTEYVDGPHVAAIAYHLELVAQGKIKRLIINLPPRYLKSVVASIAFPAYLLGHNPAWRIICLSYAAELADEHARGFISVVQSGWYRAAFPGMATKRVADNNLTTKRGGFRKTTSVGGSLTGLGGDLFIIDDPQKPSDVHSQAARDAVNNWIPSTLLSRLDNKATGAIVVVMQRLHMDDVTGNLTERSKNWTVLNLAAIAEEDEEIPIGPSEFFRRKAGEALCPEYESVETLNELRTDMGSEVFQAQYQQRPMPSGGAMIKKVWLRYYDVLPVRTYRSKIIQSWDCASKDGLNNDYSVCTTWLMTEDGHYYLIDLTRDRYDYPRLRQAAINLAERYKPTAILIEDTSSGIALSQELKQAGLYRVINMKVDRNKVERLFVQAAKFEAGKVHFPRGASFLPILEPELLQFPQVKHDDQVDSISQALAYKPFGYDVTMSWVDN